MKRRYVAASIAAWLLASACTPGGVAAPSPSRPPEPVLASYTPAPSSTIDTRPAARPATPPSLILIDDDGSGMRLRGRPIDPNTLADVPGYAPISFEHHYQAAVSPDGKTIAAVLWPGGAADSGASLHLIDTAAWVDRALAFKIDTYTSALKFDAGGSAMYWTQMTSSAPNASTSALMRLDVASGALREIMRLPDGFYVREIAVAGPRIAVYGEPILVLIDGKPRDVPSLFLIDPVAGKIASTIRLPIRAGQYQDPAAANSDEPFRLISPGFGWDLPRSRLFVADAESNRIFVVDLRTGQIRGPFEPRQRRSMIDVLWSLFGTVAEAKMVASTQQEAVVSPDGKRLYVSGLRSDFAKGQDGKYHENAMPIDLRIIDTEDMSEIARLGGATTTLWISPDGAALLYGTNRYDTSAEGYASRLDFKLHLLDTAGAREIAALPFDGMPFLTTFDAERRLAYVQSLASGNVGRATVLQIDLSTGVAIGKREMERHFADVLLLRTR